MQTFRSHVKTFRYRRLTSCDVLRNLIWPSPVGQRSTYVMTVQKLLMVVLSATIALSLVTKPTDAAAIGDWDPFRVGQLRKFPVFLFQWKRRGSTRRIWSTAWNGLKTISRSTRGAESSRITSTCSPSVSLPCRWPGTASRYYQRARSAYADQWLTFSFNFPGCWEKIPDKHLVTLPTGTM